MTDYRKLGALLLLLLVTACRPGADAESPTIVASAPTPASTAPPTETALPATAPHATVTPLAWPSATPTLLPTPTAIPPATATVPAAVVEAPGATLPAGFSMIRFAPLYRPTGLAFDGAGRLYATSFDGTVHVLVDENGDGRADVDRVFARGFNTPLGVAVEPAGSSVYVSSNGKISRLRDSNGDLVADEVEPFVTGLPVGLHQNDNLKFAPDGQLYMGVGSTCDACIEADPRSGTVMRFDVETGEGEVFASGMRNPYDLAFRPETGELFATDNGRDDLGMDAPGEELNHIVEGADYGWPGCWDRLQGPDCTGTVPAVAFFEPHSSANSLTFYSQERFPAQYTNDLFVAVFGSWLKPSVETGIAHVELEKSGNSYSSEPAWFARWEGMPLGLVAGPDGALYVGDYVNEAVYRISYGVP